MKRILAILTIGAIAMMTSCGGGGGGGGTPTDTAKAQTKTGVTLDFVTTYTLKGTFTDSEWSAIWAKVEADLQAAFIANIAPNKPFIATSLSDSTITIESSGSYTFRTVTDNKQLYYVKGKNISDTQLKQATDNMGTVSTVP